MPISRSAMREERPVRDEGRRRAVYLLCGAIAFVIIVFAAIGVLCYFHPYFVAHLCPKEKGQPMPAPAPPIEWTNGGVTFGGAGPATSDEGSEYEEEGEQDDQWRPMQKKI